MKFRFVTTAWKGLVVGNAGNTDAAVIAAKYGGAIGGVIRATIRDAIGFYFDQRYLRAIRRVDKFMRDFSQNMQQQMIFNISNNR